MWQKLTTFIRNWAIVIAGVGLIIPLLYISSRDVSSSKSAATTISSVAPSSTAAPSHAKTAILPSAAPVQTAAPASAPAPTQSAAPTMPHARMAAVKNSGQAPTAQAAPVSGDVAVGKGKLVFRKCQVCHSLEPGKNGIGPSLSAIVGKKAGSVSNFNYSPALKGSNLTWNVATLATFLSDPQKTVPGNKMPFPGLKTENERSTLLAYLAAGAPSVATAPAAASSPQAAPAPQPTSSYVPDLRYTLRTGIAEGRMVYIGVGGTIDGQVNPILSAAEGQGVQVTLSNGEGADHDREANGQPVEGVALGLLRSGRVEDHPTQQEGEQQLVQHRLGPSSTVALSAVFDFA